MKNKITDLRDHLFAVLEELRDKEKPMELARAKAIASVAQVIINSATVEVKFMNATGIKSSGFIPEEPEKLPGPAVDSRKTTVHRLR